MDGSTYTDSHAHTHKHTHTRAHTDTHTHTHTHKTHTYTRLAATKPKATPPKATKKNIVWKLNMKSTERQQTVAVNTDVIFTWTGTHDVYLLPNKKAFEECDFSKAKELASTKVNKYTFKASAAGVFYFGCKVTGHCKFTKQKLALTVTPAAGWRFVSAFVMIFFYLCREIYRYTKCI